MQRHRRTLLTTTKPVNCNRNSRTTKNQLSDLPLLASSELKGGLVITGGRGVGRLVTTGPTSVPLSGASVYSRSSDFRTSRRTFQMSNSCTRVSAYLETQSNSLERLNYASSQYIIIFWYQNCVIVWIFWDRYFPQVSEQCSRGFPLLLLKGPKITEHHLINTRGDFVHIYTVLGYLPFVDHVGHGPAEVRGPFIVIDRFDLRSVGLVSSDLFLVHKHGQSWNTEPEVRLSQ